MAQSVGTKNITTLTEKTSAADTDIYPIGDAGGDTLKRITFANILSAIQTKISSWTFSALSTTAKTIVGAVNEVASNLSSHTSSTSNPHSVTKSQVGLGNVENKSSATIRGELTKANVTDALGYTPPTTNTTYSTATTSAAGLMSASDKSKLDGIASGAQANTVTGVKGNSESSYRTGDVNITPANIGLGNVDNTADTVKSVASAAKLTTARTIQVNLSSTSAVSFNGTSNIAPGVKGTLPTKYGGTGRSDGQAASAKNDSDGNQISTTYVKKTDIVDDVTSESTDAPLSAAQGKVLQDQIDELNTGINLLKSTAAALFSTYVATDGGLTNTAVDISKYRFLFFIFKYGSIIYDAKIMPTSIFTSKCYSSENALNVKGTHSGNTAAANIWYADSNFYVYMNAAYWPVEIYGIC